MVTSILSRKIAFTRFAVSDALPAMRMLIEIAPTSLSNRSQIRSFKSEKPGLMERTPMKPKENKMKQLDAIQGIEKSISRQTGVNQGRHL
jgi:hypothetical protein